MPNLPHSIELHDSEVSAIENAGGSVIVRFSRAYIHKDGKGWSQRADLVVRTGALSCGQTSFPAKVDDGEMKTKNGPYHNLLVLPLTTDGPVWLRMEFFHGAKVTIEGEGLEVIFHGEPVFVENAVGI